MPSPGRTRPDYLDLSLTHPKRLREATLDFGEGA